MSRGGSGLELAVAGLALLLTALGGIAVHAHYGFPQLGIDDANITFVYARNWVAGHGLVFTPGFERVEGFTSAAWLALCALAFLLNPAPERGLIALSALLTAAALGITLRSALRIARATPGGRGRAAVPLLLCALWLAGLPRFYAWSTASLMESPLWALLDAAAAAGLAALALADSEAARTRALGGLTAAGALLLFTRPESFAVVPVLFGLALLLLRPASAGISAALRRLLPCGAVWLGSAVLLMGARLAYFGYPFPNTYYAKVSPDRWWGAQQGFEYLTGYFRQTPAALVLSGLGLLAAPIPGWRMLRSGASQRAALPPVRRAVLGTSALTWVFLLLPLGGGGDHFSSFRFYQVTAPLLVLPLAWLAAAALDARWGRAGRGAVLAAGLLLSLSAVHEWRAFLAEDRLSFGFRQAEAGRRKGQALSERFAAGRLPTLASIATGGVGFGYAGRVVDLMGLNWTAMGHSPGDRKGLRDHAAFHPDVFWSEAPDLVSPDLTHQPLPDACPLYRPWDLAVLQGLYVSPRFRDEYRAGSLELPQGHVSGFFRQSWLAQLPPGSVTLLSGSPEQCQQRLERAMRVASRATAKNAILVVIDTLGMKHASLDPAGHTPQLAALARSGIFFDSARSTAPWTQPSVATLLTGLLPSQHGVRVLGGILQPQRETLAEMLQARGFQTAAIVSHELLSAHYGFDQGFDHFDAEHLGGHLGITSNEVTDAAIRWLDDRDPERPFFLLVHYFDPHYAYQHHPEFSLTDGYRGPLSPGIGIEKLLALRPTLTREDIDYLIGLHHEEAAFADAAIGRLLAHLDALGVAADTLVVLTADHGEEFMERGWIGHTRTLYDELLHVPLVFRHPRLPARHIPVPVSLRDVAPTLAELLGVAFPEIPGAGRSLARVLRNPALVPSTRDVLAEVTYLPRTPGNDQAEMMRAVKTSVLRGSLKAIHDAETGRFELYDLADDPGETRDLSATHPRARELAQKLEGFEAAGGHGSAAQVKSLLEEESRRLEQLGYAH